MTKPKAEPVLHITFHDPNVPEETARYFAKLLAQSIAQRELAERKSHRD